MSTDEPPSDDNVIPIALHRDYVPKAEGSETLVRADRCRHRARILHEKERAVRCGECSARLDPFDVLVKIASDQERRLADFERLTALTARARQDVQTLERLERNVRARLKRAMGDGAPEKKRMIPPGPPVTFARQGSEVLVTQPGDVERMSGYEALHLAQELATVAHAAIESIRQGEPKGRSKKR